MTAAPIRAGLPDPLNIIVLRGESEATLERMRSVWPGHIRATVITERDDGTPERATALREGHIAFVTAGCPRDLGALMPNLMWVHARFVGISELNNCDYWGSDISMTSARGSASTASRWPRWRSQGR